MKRNVTKNRKNDHIQICLNEKVNFSKSNGFEKYEFIHNAITEVDINKIELNIKLFNKQINYPFLISCMTGGTNKATDINKELAICAETLKVPVGVGSQRQALENDKFHSSYKTIRKNAPTVPIFGNIGAAEISQMKNFDGIKLLIDLIEADVFVIHLNSTQELFQKEGNTNFVGLLKNLEKLTKFTSIPIFVKEVGNGINYSSAKQLLECGVKGIDVAGAGGTSWQKVEMLRNKKPIDNYFANWGLPTSYCVKEVSQLKEKNSFYLIASGGITNGVEIAKALALGADLCASANIVLKTLIDDGIDGTIIQINKWFNDVKKIMYLTGSQTLIDLNQKKLIKIEDLY